MKRSYLFLIVCAVLFVGCMQEGEDPSFAYYYPGEKDPTTVNVNINSSSSSGDSDVVEYEDCGGGCSAQSEGCTADSDCPAGYMCEDGECFMTGECIADSDCPPGQVCDVDQTCVDADDDTGTGGGSSGGSGSGGDWISISCCYDPADLSGDIPYKYGSFSWSMTDLDWDQDPDLLIDDEGCFDSTKSIDRELLLGKLYVDIYDKSEVHWGGAHDVNPEVCYVNGEQTAVGDYDGYGYAFSAYP